MILCSTLEVEGGFERWSEETRVLTCWSAEVNSMKGIEVSKRDPVEYFKGFRMVEGTRQLRAKEVKSGVGLWVKRLNQEDFKRVLWSTYLWTNDWPSSKLQANLVFQSRIPLNRSVRPNSPAIFLAIPKVVQISSKGSKPAWVRSKSPLLLCRSNFKSPSMRDRFE